ncbi:RNA polymerase sigma-70 factor (sigma-E family) [Actinoplanes campanulatus]|uniref:RNA polymerase sigma-70 factor (Sigma-E family) n=1 Tax=Actinoplanes campanulatus TaxID=113559 RepID=A0A7W5AS33_9ACTN|nr:SigE family RNA polymerase sigma factor [Actinoplanes campanulatus]MBB3101403.1 RNA polymerase sigma-70 factor (sigma-E family) [Actinoplanes campanulatus]GGN49552.1 DNA-directed RNA polymerase sigma-70 factor [Actinoplanes campanulatus]GID42239.1 DNA-directed RNA polymerase sigma-70 factor [Actinoplanes campanulatus]
MGEVDDDFHEFVVYRSPALSRVAYLLTGDHHLAEDLLQSALARAFPRWRRIRDGDPAAYVRRVMYHQHISWWRRRRVVEVQGWEGLDPAGADSSEASALRLTLAAALRRLTPRQRAVLVLRFYEDLTEAQVARELGLSVGTVKRHGHDGLSRLRTIAPELIEAATDRAESDVSTGWRAG